MLDNEVGGVSQVGAKRQRVASDSRGGGTSARFAERERLGWWHCEI